MVPYIGDLAKAGKLGGWAKTIDNVLSMAADNADFAKTVKPVLNKISSAIDRMPSGLQDSVNGNLRAVSKKIDEFYASSPYDPNKVRADLEAVHGPDNVRSTTNPNNPLQRVNSDLENGIEVITGVNGSKAVRVQYKDPLTGEDLVANVPYNERGLPIFDDVAKFTTSIDKSKSYDAQMRAATRELRENIDSGKLSASSFTQVQLKSIKAGDEKIPGFTWHHNPLNNTMQLVPFKVHKSVLHIGERALNEGR